MVSPTNHSSMQMFLFDHGATFPAPGLLELDGLYFSVEGRRMFGCVSYSCSLSLKNCLRAMVGTKYWKRCILKLIQLSVLIFSPVHHSILFEMLLSLQQLSSTSKDGIMLKEVTIRGRNCFPSIPGCSSPT